MLQLRRLAGACMCSTHVRRVRAADACVRWCLFGGLLHTVFIRAAAPCCHARLGCCTHAPEADALNARGHQVALSPSALLFMCCEAGSNTLSLRCACSCHTATAVNSLVFDPMGNLLVHARGGGISSNIALKQGKPAHDTRHAATACCCLQQQQRLNPPCRTCGRAAWARSARAQHGRSRETAAAPRRLRRAG